MIKIFKIVVFLINIGVRKCYFNYVQDAIAKLSPIIFGRKHPIYQNILYSNARDLILMPSELREIMHHYVSGSKNNIEGKCQGGDAMLEELNKDSKSWLKNGRGAKWWSVAKRF